MVSFNCALARSLSTSPSVRWFMILPRTPVRSTMVRVDRAHPPAVLSVHHGGDGQRRAGTVEDALADMAHGNGHGENVAPLALMT